MPFLKAASLLQFHLFDDILPSNGLKWLGSFSDHKVATPLPHPYHTPTTHLPHTYHTSSTPLPHYDPGLYNFLQSLCEYLSLVPLSTSINCISAAIWHVPNPQVPIIISKLITSLPKVFLINEFSIFYFDQDEWLAMSKNSFSFNRPRLLTPPDQYSDFLKRYLGEKCCHCGKRPKEMDKTIFYHI